MSIKIEGDNNIVAKGDVIINGTKEKFSDYDIPEVYKEKYYKLLEYILQENDTKEKKESKIFNFVELLMKSGATTIAGEVTKYLLGLL